MGKTSHKENKDHEEKTATLFFFFSKDIVKLKEGIIHATERLQLGFASKQGYLSFKSPNILTVNSFSNLFVFILKHT